MSKWDEAHNEPMHDHPAEKDQLVAAMEAAGYVLDTAESTENRNSFFGASRNGLKRGRRQECEERMNGPRKRTPASSERWQSSLYSSGENRTSRLLVLVLIHAPFLPDDEECADGVLPFRAVQPVHAEPSDPPGQNPLPLSARTAWPEL